MQTHLKNFRRTAGKAPGIEHDELIGQPAGDGTRVITCIDYSPLEVQVNEVADPDHCRRGRLRTATGGEQS